MSKKGFVQVLAALSHLPLPLLRGVGGIFEWIFRYIPTKTAAYGRLNMEIARPLFNVNALTAAEWQTLQQQAQRNEILSYFEFLHIWGSSNAANIARIHRVNGEAYFQQALQQKRGVILVIPHLGTWEVMNAWLSQHTAMTIMYKPLKNKAADEFVRAARSRERATLVPTDDNGVKAIFRTLKQGGVTAILPDHSPEHGQAMTAWFGVPLYSSQLTAKLAQKTGATPLLIYAIRNTNGGFDLTIEPLPDLMTRGDSDGTAILYRYLQNLIARYPQHYHWSYKRFKANPATGALYTLPPADALALIRRIQADTAAI